MSKQAKQRNKRAASKAAKGQRHGNTGASGVPSRQPAPPWVRDGTRKPAARKAKQTAKREAADGN